MEPFDKNQHIFVDTTIPLLDPFTLEEILIDFETSSESPSESLSSSSESSLSELETESCDYSNKFSLFINNLCDDMGFPEPFDNSEFTDNDDIKLYPNSAFSLIITLSLLFSRSSSFPDNSKEAFGRLLFIRHNYLLPPGNVMPSIYVQAVYLIHRHLIKPKEFDCCVNDCLLFRNEHKDLSECQKIASSRYKQETNIPKTN